MKNIKKTSHSRCPIFLFLKYRENDCESAASALKHIFSRLALPVNLDARFHSRSNANGLIFFLFLFWVVEQYQFFLKNPKMADINT